MAIGFDGRVAIVTGAGGGLGRAHALLLAAEGAAVVVNDYGGDSHGNAGTTAMADRVVAEITAAGGVAVADGHDVATDGAAIVERALDEFGGLHIVVNTSSASVFGLPGTSHYITAKAAIFGLTRALSHDGRSSEIRVNAVMPSAYSRLTAQSPEFAPVMQAGFPPEKVSPFVCALASREVPCTGETFVVGGGRAARVVLATVPGLHDLTSIDDCLSRVDEAMDMTELTVPADAMNAVIYECAQIGLDLSQFAPAS